MLRTKKNRQTFAFPSTDQESFTDAELDAQIDGTVSAGKPSTKTADTRRKQLEKDADDKKKNAQAVKDIPQIFTPDQVVWVFDVYVGGICFIFSLLLKCEFKVLYEELKLDEDVKLAWAKPLARVASKYAPAEWAGMTAEIELCASLGIWTAAAFGRSKAIAEKEKEKKEAETRKPRNAVTAVPSQAQVV
jgi:hypothetical protein